MLALALSLAPALAADEPVMSPWGQLQVFTTLWDQDVSPTADPASYGDPEADPGFQLARARFGFTGVLPMRSDTAPRVDYGLSLGISTPYDALRLSDSGVSMVDGYGRIRLSPGVGETAVSLGLVKVPFSREALMSSQDLVFMERGVAAESLTSVRDVGGLLRQEIDLGEGDDAPLVAVSVGVFNGNASFLGDQDPGVMGSARIELAKGQTYRTWDPAGGVAYGVAASTILNSELATRTFAWNADGFVRVGRWSLLAELGHSTLTPTDTTLFAPDVFAKTGLMAWTAQTTWFQPLSDAEQDVPGVEIALRASSIDDDTGIRDNGDVLILHAGATVRSVLPMVDLGAGFIHREELAGASRPNDTIRIWTQLRPRRR
ncbi:MAG: hypothetical protein KC656_05180 [Myxococcales bacterium]|nr:hypothetical protein [Myxococcales bacterium]MCB9670420.1 hypothetical protein [Alphaproteobacteria bacterium]